MKTKVKKIKVIFQKNLHPLIRKIILIKIVQKKRNKYNKTIKLDDNRKNKIYRNRRIRPECTFIK